MLRPYDFDADLQNGHWIDDPIDQAEIDAERRWQRFGRPLAILSGAAVVCGLSFLFWRWLLIGLADWISQAATLFIGALS